MARADALGLETGAGADDAEGRARQAVPARDAGQQPVRLVEAEVAASPVRAQAELPHAVAVRHLQGRDAAADRPRELVRAPVPPPHGTGPALVARTGPYPTIAVAPHGMRGERRPAAVGGPARGPGRPGALLDARPQFGREPARIVVRLAQIETDGDGPVRGGPHQPWSAAHEPRAVGLVADRGVRVARAFVEEAQDRGAQRDAGLGVRAVELGREDAGHVLLAGRGEDEPERSVGGRGARERAADATAEAVGGHCELPGAVAETVLREKRYLC